MRDDRYTKKQKRIIEMEQLREVERWTLQEIGEKYGISRERVRQLIGNTGRRNLVNALEMDAELLRDELYYNESTTVKAIAAKYRVAPTSVRRALGPRWRYLLALGLRKCTVCKQALPVDHFPKSKRFKRVGYSGVCHECNRIKAREYYQNKSKQG